MNAPSTRRAQATIASSLITSFFRMFMLKPFLKFRLAAILALNKTGDA
jgi:hypothetical protein